MAKAAFSSEIDAKNEELEALRAEVWSLRVRVHSVAAAALERGIAPPQLPPPHAEGSPVATRPPARLAYEEVLARQRAIEAAAR